MIIESRILELGGDKVRKEIIKLKERGMKTEPAFANYLRLNGDPYKELLQLETFSDDEIKKILNINEDKQFKSI